MAELPAELVHAILLHIPDHRSIINMSYTCRLFYATAMPVIIAQESKYIREVMIPGKHLSIYEYPDSRVRLPPARLDSGAGPFTGTFRKISFMPRQDFKYMCCICRITWRVQSLERISMDVMKGSSRSWITRYINICVRRPAMEFVLNGQEGLLQITVDGAQGGSTYSAPQNVNLHRLFKLSGGEQVSSSSSTGVRGLIPPQIRALKLVNEYIFSSHLAPIVRALAAGEHITSFTLVNVHARSAHVHKINHSQNGGFTNTPEDINSVLASLTFPCLTHLSLVHLTPSARALMQFLVRHPLITDLKLDLPNPTSHLHADGHHSHHNTTGSLTHSALSAISSITGSTSLPNTPPRGFMPNLARLSGTVHWVLPFVRWRLAKKSRIHLPALEALELLPGPGTGVRTIGSVHGMSPTQDGEFADVYDLLFRAEGERSGSGFLKPTRRSKSASSSSIEAPLSPTSPSSPTSASTTCIRTLTLSASLLIDWILEKGSKHQHWPVFPLSTIEELMISDAETFTVPPGTPALRDGLLNWRPDMLSKDERQELERWGDYADVDMADAGTQTSDEDGASYPDSEARPRESLTQRVLKRIIWHTFPTLETLQVGVDKRDSTPGTVQRIRRPGDCIV